MRAARDRLVGHASSPNENGMTIAERQTTAEAADSVRATAMLTRGTWAACTLLALLIGLDPRHVSRGATCPAASSGPARWV